MRRRVMLITDTPISANKRAQYFRLLEELGTFIATNGGAIKKRVDIESRDFDVFSEKFNGYRSIIIVTTKSAGQTLPQSLMKMSAVACRNKNRTIILATDPTLREAFKHVFKSTPVAVIASIDELPGSLTAKEAITPVKTHDRCLLPPHNTLRSEAVCVVCRRDCQRAGKGKQR